MLGFAIEDQHTGIVAGVDEVGRGPLAGPVVAACVSIPKAVRTHYLINEIKDSKKLTEIKRKKLFLFLKESCHISLASIEPEEIDKINILNASLKAMTQSIVNIGKKLDHVFVDGNRLPENMPCPGSAIIKGDSQCISIAAASIVAKVTRDELMKKLSVQYPHYGWDRNMGYPTKEHCEALGIYGPSPYHRRSFGSVREVILNRAAS